MSSSVERPTPVDAAAYAAIEDQLATLLQTRRDVILLQGESILALEAVARGAGAPTARSLNVVTSPYGEALGRWLEAAGGAVESLPVGFERAVELHEVTDVLARGDIDIVSVVHAEAATGALNPLAQIAASAHAAGALVIVDAVASIGAEPLQIDAWDLDVTVVSAQKALAGPAGVCAVVISDRGWRSLELNPAAPRDSILSLLDWRERWVRPGRRQLPVIPHQLETRSLAVTLARIEQESLEATIDRHWRARDAVRAGLRAMGREPWIADDDSAAAIATIVASPGDVAPGELLAGSLRAVPQAPLELAPGPLATRALRIAHTGENARLAPVLAALAALALGLRSHGIDADADAALAGALDGWQRRPA
jgi:aspartate aminotransferase-like enzyme